MEKLNLSRSHGCTQGVNRHQLLVTGTDMVSSVFVPQHSPGVKLPVLWNLSCLTCTHANVTEKSEYWQACAHKVIFVAPDTSQRGDALPDDDNYNFGKDPGFYVVTTEAPWATHFKMRFNTEDDLPARTGTEFPMCDMSRQGSTRHSMGGHGALMSRDR